MSETKDLLRKRFEELNKLRDDILAKSTPLRQERDRIANEVRGKELDLIAKIKVIEKDLYQIDMDRGMLARALGGRRMSDSRTS